MPERSYRVLLWSLALLGLCLDQASKYTVFAWLTGEKEEYVLFGTKDSGFKLIAQYKDADSPHVNQGALFGITIPGLTKENSNLFFAGVSLLAAAAIVYWSTQKSTAVDRWLCVALGLILAGTLGNFYDRVMFSGVRDFLHWNYLFDWPVFNIADCCLVFGAGLLLIQAFGTVPVAKTEESHVVAASGKVVGATAAKS